MRATFAKTPVRFATDAVLGLGVFTGLTTAMLGQSAAAGLLGIKAGASAFSGAPVLAQSLASSHFLASPSYGFIALAMVFSTLFAFNIAFVRHVRRASDSVQVALPNVAAAEKIASAIHCVPVIKVPA